MGYDSSQSGYHERKPGLAGLEDTEEKQRRFQEEARRFVQRWEAQLDAGDPYYNPNLSVTKTDCSLRMPWEQEAWRKLCTD